MAKHDFVFEVYRSFYDGAPVKIRTSNLLIRSQMLYPVELRAHNLAFTNENYPPSHQKRVVLSREIPSHNSGGFMPTAT